MITAYLPASNRVFLKIQFAITALLLIVLSGFASPASAQVPASGPKIWLQDNQPLGVHRVGAAAAAASQPVSMATGDIDGDGINDMVVGYSSANGGFISVHRGNLDAFAPQSDASLQAVANGQFPAPFLPDAQTFSVPVTPDFLGLGNFTGDGQRDLILAARGSSTLYVFPGDGHGGFGPAQTVGVPGGVTSLAVGEFGPSAQFSTVLIGVTGVGKSFSLIVMGGSYQGLNLAGAIPLKGAASNFDFGNFGGGNDAAFLSGGQIFILRSASLQLSQVSLPFTVKAFALGSFLFDRNGGAQIAALAGDGSVSIVARTEFDPRTYTNDEFQAIRSARLRNEVPPLVPVTSFPVNGWKVVETLPAVGTVPPGQNPVFFRSRISVNGADDVMWLNAGSNRMAVISHADSAPGAQTFAPGQVSIKPYTGAPLAAVATRINVDSRLGVLAIHQGEGAPSVSMPIPDPVFTVNTTADGVFPGACAAATPGQCTLREALLEANGDTVIVPAGTYTLTLPKVANDCTGAHGALSVEHTVTITGAVDGAGNPASIVQAGTVAYSAGPANGVDMVMNVNEDLGTANCPVTSASATISNLVLQNGHNRGLHGIDGDGGCMEFDTGSLGTATLGLTNVILQNCDTTQGSGGGLANFNFIVATGTGQATFSGSTIQGNAVADNSGGSATAAGGGIFVTDSSRITMTNSNVLNNQAIQHTVATGNGFGGGLYILSKGTIGQTPQTQIHSSTISGNQSAFQGGGVWATANLLIDQGSVISNNLNGQNGAGVTDGGGLFLNPVSTLTQTLSKTTISGNTSTGRGGAIAAGAVGAGAVNIFFSRLAGNTAASTGSNLENLGATVNATTNGGITGSGQNWWGTNAAGSTIHTTTGTTTFDPFIVLTHNSTPHPIKINGTSTLTGDLSKDNHGTAITTTNLTQIVGLPITFDNPVLGSIPQAQPETLGNPTPTATATFNAGNTSGRGSANATVDQAVVGANTNLIASATEAGTTATITTVGTHNFSAGETVVVSGVANNGYNGTFVISATPTPTTFTYTAPAALGASSGGLANVGIIVLEPLQVTKSFAPTTVATNTASTITFSITNPNVMPVDANFTDNLPANVGTVPGSLVVATTPSIINTCGGTVTAVAGAGSISFSNASLPVGTCSVKVNVQSSVDNPYSNSVTVNSTQAGTGALSTSSANLLVINPPSIAKAFGAASIPLNGTTSLTFTVSSTNQNETLNGISFTDSLPAGLLVATPSGLTTDCTGTATAAAGSSSVSLSGASLAPGTSCTVSVNVQGTTAGVKNNSVTASDTTAGTGNTSNASLTVVAPPTIAKAFGAATIPLNGTTTVTFTINNPNTTAAGDLTGVAFSDTLPSTTGTLVVAATPGVVNTCNGTVTATAGTGVISLSGATVAHNGSCTLTVNVTGTAAGDAANTTGAITSTEGGTGATSNTATLKIVAPPTISKAFGTPSVPLNGTTTVTFTIANPGANTTGQTGIAFSDTLTNGLQVASTPSVTNTCNGTVTAAAASTSISLSGGTVATGGSCTLSVNVTGTVAGAVTNTTGAISSTEGGTGATSNTANLTVVAPPSIAKAFGAASVPLGGAGATTLDFTITNPNATATLTGISFTDNFPAGIIIPGNGANLNNTCGGNVSASPLSGAVFADTITLPAGAHCDIIVTVEGTTAGVKNNSVQVNSANGGLGNTGTATILIVAPPTISKAFGAASIPLNGTTTVTFTISNPNTAVGADLTGLAFSDTLPSTTGKLVVAATPGVVNTCNGTVTATAGTGVISLSGGSVVHNSSCTLTVNVTGTAAGDANNTTSTLNSTEGGTGGASNTATLKIVAPPTISKAFGAAAISLNGTTTVTFTITNPAANTSAENGIAFSDTLTGGLQVASTPGVTNSCGGTVTAAANSTSVSLTGGSIATPGATCTIVVNVTGTQSGTVTNTTGAISSTNGGTGAASNTATLIVASPATVTKVFGATRIPLNGTTSLTITITNPNTNVSLTGLSFTDNLPAGLVIAGTPNLSNTCGGTATATAGSGSLSLSGGTLAASASCAVSVNVQGTTAGDKNNSVTVNSTEGGASTTATATLTVVAPPAISKAFGAASIPLNGTTTVTFTISNPNNPATPANGDLTGVAFSDTLPVSGGPGSATLVVAGTPGVTNTCGGTVTATAGTGVISLSGASVAHNSSCTLNVNVTGTVEGDANNTTGAISSTEGGTGLASNTATLKVVAPPTISKAFGAANITLNGTTTVTFTITNPASNTSAENGIAFSDTLTGGLQVASTPGVTNSCGGTVTAAANSTSISLTGGSIATPGATCTIVVNVTGTQSGTVTNTTGAVSSTNGGTGATSNTATLIVASPANVTKSFGASKIPLNGTTSLTINISNPNTNVSLTGLSFTDNLPAGLVIATPNGLNNTCGGTATATAGSGSLSLSGGTLAASASCAVTVNVTGTTGGDKSNSVQVSSTEGGTSATASASITVVAPPTIAKAFGAGSIPLNGTTTLTFTISNPNTSVNGDLTGVAFSDTLPVSGSLGTATLVISGTPNVSNTCGGTATATAGTGVISLSGASVAHNATCTLSVDVQGTVAGDANNTTGAISSTEGGTGVASNTALLKVVAPPSIAKVFNPGNIALNATTSLNFTITNPAGNTTALAGVAFTDVLPTGLTIADGSSTVCGGTLTTTAATRTIALSGATVNTASTCTFSVTVTGATAGQYTNTTGNVTSTNGGTGNTATANLTVATAPTITKAFGAASILLNASTSLTFNISNPNAAIGVTGVAFSDTLPAGLVVATPNGVSSTCGGTTTAAAGSGSISLSGGTLAANGSCSISLNVTGVQAGVQNNTTGPISSNESGAGATSNTASITVIGPPSIAKAFGAASINLNAQTTLTFTITNPNATVALTGVGFGDTLPAGLAVANPNGLTGSCGSGTITTGTVSGFSVVNLSGGTIAAGGSCSFSVNVVGTSGGHKVNTTGTVTSSNAGSGNQATATIDVLAPDPTITKTHTGTFTRGQTGAQWTITVKNVGFGPTVGTVTVTDTLPNVINPPVATAVSGTGWTCNLATLTCTRADALPSGSSYPPITLTVNIPINIANNFTNTATVSGGGDVNPNNNTATDKISLGPPIVITPQINSATTKAGLAAGYNFTVEDDDPTLGPVVFSCAGLPAGTACTFNPASTTQPLSQVTMSLSTSGGSGSNMVSGRLLGPGPRPPFYALLLPALALLGITMTGRRKKARLRLALVFAGIMTLLALAGCGGAHGITTPPGTYNVTVNATTATVQASTQITLTVQ